MPWPLGVSELQARLKNALGIRGAIPLELDESIIPVVTVYDVGAIPWQLDPRIGIGFRSIAASPGNFSVATIVSASGTRLHVRRLWLISQGVANDSIQLRLGFGLGACQQIASMRDRFYVGGAISRLAAIECTATPAAAPGTMFALHRLLAAGSLEINLDIVLDGDDPAGAQ
ncbi:MAG TPA: hypothetical protein VFR23_24870, partial [Jiangellaceae bacterium]|nr:hypothetical protein [Jiangellaceae bacterium]